MYNFNQTNFEYSDIFGANLTSQATPNEQTSTPTGSSSQLFLRLPYPLLSSLAI